MIEHEFDHVYIGVTDAHPEPNPKEVAEWQYFKTEELQKMMDENPELFTEWFKIAVPKVLKHIENTKLWVA
jgi:isopentenyl-diphosphate delta-isomerase